MIFDQLLDAKMAEIEEGGMKEGRNDKNDDWDTEKTAVGNLEMSFKETD